MMEKITPLYSVSSVGFQLNWMMTRRTSNNLWISGTFEKQRGNERNILVAECQKARQLLSVKFSSTTCEIPLGNLSTAGEWWFFSVGIGKADYSRKTRCSITQHSTKIHHILTKRDPFFLNLTENNKWQWSISTLFYNKTIIDQVTLNIAVNIYFVAIFIPLF